eukprot:CAMPEP_0197556878 /NCGR_PEP_ID=MMETSP1320-20131121/15962_1 /TAXON_ID=91990 /ORGANISM="Bolidomonas sp., Strain RCC2347" /LENGTH=85 /DNA_ID=CAMNT_0043118047 /DNA_START=272 /DNA_END=527 /DNA_ORIENTATION=+
MARRGFHTLGRRRVLSVVKRTTEGIFQSVSEAIKEAVQLGVLDDVEVVDFENGAGLDSVEVDFDENGEVTTALTPVLGWIIQNPE